jgi:hypothetical protein
VGLGQQRLGLADHNFGTTHGAFGESCVVLFLMGMLCAWSATLCHCEPFQYVVQHIVADIPVYSAARLENDGCSTLRLLGAH